jgi:hypothetical protein
MTGKRKDTLSADLGSMGIDAYCVDTTEERLRLEDFFQGDLETREDSV